MKKTIILNLAVLLVVIPPAAAAQLLVPGQYATIQAAIDAAADGDEIIVADGIYTGEVDPGIDFQGKAITVRSENGPENCVIKCLRPGRGFYFGSGEDANSILEGFTITEGNAYWGGGGGIYCEASSPVIKNCIITGNLAFESGGGIYCEGGDPAITNCVITDNSAFESGGGIFCEGDDPAITNCIITGNSADYGSGVYCEGGSPTIIDCAIFENGTYSPKGGGGICSIESNAVIINCTINLNRGGRYGGGVYCEGGSPTIIDCIITQNTAYYGGGGVYSLNSNLKVEGCTISEHQLPACYSIRNRGSAIDCDESSVDIINCTISDNAGQEGDSAISCDESTVRIVDCNISQNLGSGIYCQTGSLIVKGCSISENWGFYAGAISCWDSSLAMERCSVTGNSEGIFCYEGTAEISNCVISHNSSSEYWGVVGCSGRLVLHDSIISGNMVNSKQSWGGGITLVDLIDSGFGPSEIRNCLITGNVVEKGGTIASYCENAAITNCTISGNTAEKGASIFCGYGSVTASNCIMWGNAAQDDSQIYLGSVTDTSGNQCYSALAVSYSDVEWGLDAVHVEPNCVLNWGEGNVDSDPCFVAAGYWWDVNGTPDDVNDDFWVEGDYHLQVESACVNAGDPNYIAGPNETDLDGVPRVLFGRIDMGAYEYNLVETEMKLTPHTLNCASSGDWVEAHFVLPEGYLPGDVDINTPAVAEPVGLESAAIEVLDEGDGRYLVVAVFDRQAFCEAIAEGTEKELEVTVIGSFTDGLRFYGTDTIRLISDHWRHHISIINSERAEK